MSRPLPPRWQLFVLAGLLLLTPSAGATTVEKRTTASADDAEENSLGAVSRSSSDLEMTWDSDTQTVGMRWTALAIPPGAYITTAYVQFSAKSSQSGATALMLRGQAADNAVGFGTATGDISTRPVTTAFASWAPPAWTAGDAGADQRTPDLSALIQEIVSRPGWASGNALVLIVTGTGQRTAWAYDGDASASPLLHVEFQEGPPGELAPDGTIDYPPTDVTIQTGQSVTFQGSGTDPDNHLPLTYSWEFGGGAADQTVEDPGPVTFISPGTYLVRFTVRDSFGMPDPTPPTRLVSVNGPVLQPADEIHWTIKGQTAVTFDWRGGTDTLRYGPTTAYGQIAIGMTPSPLPFSSAGPFREAKITGLTENTTYHYSVGGAADRTFRTPPPRGTSDFTVVAQGDIGSSKFQSRVAPIQAQIATLAPDIVLGLGDFTYANVRDQTAVDTHFNDVMAWSLEIPYMPAWGNHEHETPAMDDLRNYKGRFDLPNPQTSPTAPSGGCCGEDWSWFDYGNVRFIAHPEPYTSAAWDDWLAKAGPIMDEAQADPAIAFIVTFGHRPAFSSGWHPGESRIQNHIATLGASHSKFVLNLNGHSHDYERSYPQSGVVHVTAGTGGASLEAEIGTCKWTGGCPAPAWSAYRAMHHVVLQLRFTGSTIEGTAYCGPADATNNDVVCVPGTILDTFTIQGTVGVGAPPRPDSRQATAWIAPLPVRDAASLHFLNDRAGAVSIALFDVEGRMVREVVDHEWMEGGPHRVELDCRDRNGVPLRSGLYLARVRMPDGVATGRFLVVR